ncbi:hypothetical protein NKH18_50370 [Streptomyces sp. M10(2022)]
MVRGPADTARGDPASRGLGSPGHGDAVVVAGETGTGQLMFIDTEVDALKDFMVLRAAGPISSRTFPARCRTSCSHWYSIHRLGLPPVQSPAGGRVAARTTAGRRCPPCPCAVRGPNEHTVNSAQFSG